MNWLVWKQHRKQFAFALGLLIIFAAYVFYTGTHASRANDTTLNLVRASIAAPLLLGMFWGAPLISKEYEDGTTGLVWTQSVSRRRWLTAKLGWMLLAAALYGAAYALLVGWWLHRAPGVATIPGTQQNFIVQPPSRFDAAQFDITGLMPAVYAMFAVALGAALGAWRKRAMAALGIILVIFIALQYSVATRVRPYYMKPLRHTDTAQDLSNPHLSFDSNMLFLKDGGMSCQTHPNGVTDCNSAAGQWYTYQPGYRYWDFQRIEAGIYLGLTVITAAIAYELVLRRDA